MAGASLVMFFLAAEVFNQQRSSFTMNGSGYFEVLSLLLVGAIWVIVPLLTADCVSRERREGTLPLLFLTPLTPMEVAAAKSAAQVLRALTVVVAVLPILLIPVLMGGVTWMDGAKTALISLGCLLVALSFGLLASTFCKGAGAALLTAVLFSAIARGGDGERHGRRRLAVPIVGPLADHRHLHPLGRLQRREPVRGEQAGHHSVAHHW